MVIVECSNSGNFSEQMVELLNGSYTKIFCDDRGDLEALNDAQIHASPHVDIQEMHNPGSGKQTAASLTAILSSTTLELAIVWKKESIKARQWWKLSRQSSMMKNHEFLIYAAGDAFLTLLAYSQMSNLDWFAFLEPILK